MASSMGTASGTDIPIEHLDYSYIEKCTNFKEIEKILRVLRSNKEGHYPNLITFTEKRLLHLNPTSKLLVKDKKAKTLSDLPQNEYRKIAAELDNWEQQMSAEDSKLKSEGQGGGEWEHTITKEEGGTLPAVRDTTVISGKPDAKGSQANHVPKKDGPRKIQSHDYRTWDKYNADVEAAKVDAEPKDDIKVSKTKVSAQLSDKELSMSAAEKQRASVREKEKGNEAFRVGEHHEALAYYTRSIALHPSAAAYNNRAITAIKMENYQDAIADCTKVLELDPRNTKALFRRATAHSGMKRYRNAAADLECLLQLDPSNKKAQEQLNKLQTEFLKKKQGGVKESAATRGGEEEKSGKKGRRIQIKEVEGSESEEGGEEVGPSKQNKPSTETDTSASLPKTAASNGHSVGSAPPVVYAPPPLPPQVEELKEKGNRQFRKGQYGDALVLYSKAIKLLEREGKAHEPSLSILLNNRAACHLKNGDCRRCVEDCTLSISLVPLNLKAFMRRAAAYETLEKYKQAYNDYHLALRIDSTVEAAYTACSRITYILREQEGNQWRSKLPPHPESERVLAALSSKFSLPTTGGGGKGEVKEGESVGGDATVKHRTEADSKVENSERSGKERSGEERSGDVGDGVQQAEKEDSDRVKEEVGGGERVKEEGMEGEQLFSIPVVTSTATTPGHYSTKVTQSTDPVTSTSMADGCSSSGSSPPSEGGGVQEREESTEEKFERYKIKGKGHVERGEFVDALNCYAVCVDTCPDKAVAYTNRAHCYLKLKTPKKAEDDCTKALELEPLNVKALYRRGLARKELKRYGDAVKDFKTLLDTDSTIAVAKKELETAKQLWEKQLREIQSRQQASQKMTQKSQSKSPSGKPKEVKKPPQARDKKGAKEGMKDGSKRSPKMQQSTAGNGGLQSDARTSTSGTGEGESLLSAAKTTYFKDKKAESDSGVQRKRVQVVVKDGNSGSSEEEEEKGERGEGGGSSGEEKVSMEPPITTKPVQESARPVPRSAKGSSTTRDKLASGYEFLQKWNAIPRTAPSIEYANLLEQIPPDTLPEVITNKLDGIMLTNIIRAIDKQFIPRGLYELSINILQNLAKVPRFGMITMFLNPLEKQDLGKVFRALSTQTKCEVSPSTLAHLRSTYGVNE